MRFSHILITRPQRESEELAALLAPLGIPVIVQAAQKFRGLEPSAEQMESLSGLRAANGSPLLLFTSTRAVDFGLPALPGGLAGTARIAAIGPATAKALEAAGFSVDLRPASGYTSEALLSTLESELMPSGSTAIILAAPGGRKKLAQSLEALGWNVLMLWVYERHPADLDKEAVDAIRQAGKTLSVWTSANAMNTLSQRLPPAAWFQVCQGEWVVISKRLRKLARAFGPSKIHLAPGPGNAEILCGIRAVI
jgi:uroporphyrinogen-III synthase